MSYEYFFVDGRGRNEAAFEGKLVEIKNPHRHLDNQLFKSIQTFHTKKESIEFCKTWDLNPCRIIRVESRFQYGWALDMGRNSFVPVYAIGYLSAKALGKTLSHVLDSSMGFEKKVDIL